jgi:hypothetical protein
MHYQFTDVKIVAGPVKIIGSTAQRRQSLYDRNDLENISSLYFP